MPKGLMVVSRVKITAESKYGLLKCTSMVVLKYTRWPLKYNDSYIFVSRTDRKMILVPKGMFSGSRNSMLWGIEELV